jgi:hypothetical protein
MPRQIQDTVAQDHTLGPAAITWLRMGGFTNDRSPLHGEEGRFSSVDPFFRG